MWRFNKKAQRRKRTRPARSIQFGSGLDAELLERRELLATSAGIAPEALPASGPQILLTPAMLATLQQEASANTPQWQAFKNNLDNQLDNVFGPGTYQGDYLTLIADYALGYQVLKDNPSTVAEADNYADKAIGLMKSGMNDYQRGTGTQALQFLAQGDSTTTTYTLPGAGIHPDTMEVVIAPVTTVAVTHGTANGQDAVDFSETFLKVSNTQNGPASYVAGTDWSHNPDYANDDIDWSLPGAEPAVGSTYYVTETSSSDENRFAVPANSASSPGGNFYTLNGNTLTFAKPIGANQAIFVQYVYGVHSANGSSLAYQQTSAGDGGFNSIFVDTTYSSRYLGKYIAIGLDWLYNYPGLTQSLKQQATSLLVRWSDYVRDNGYYADSPASNYGAGGYDSRVMTALALSDGRDPTDDPRLLQEVQAYRNQYVKPLLTAATTSLAGGFWAEGWNYGPLAIQNILLAEQALETAGLATETAGLAPGAEEHQWASQVIASLISEQPTRTTIYDGGDGYNFPAPFPGRDLIDIVAAVSNDPTMRSYANYMLQNYTLQQPENTPSFWIDMVYRNPSAPASFWSAFPTQYKAAGTGLVTARADWSYNSTFVSLQMGNILQADHQTFSPGLLEIFRGGDDLLANANASNGVQPDQSQYGNTVVINSNGDTDSQGNPVQNYPFNMGVWYGTPGVSLTAFDASSGFVYTGGNYRAAYSTANDPGGDGPATNLTRQVVYLRPNLVIVHDRVATLKPTYLKQLRWNFLGPTTVSGDSFVEQVGSSKLFGETFSNQPLTTTVTAYNNKKDAQGEIIDPVGYDPRPFFEVATNNTKPSLAVNYTTAFQTAAKTATSMVATTSVKSADGRMEGVEIGGQLVLFGANGTLPASVSAISVTVAGAAPSSAILVDLQPGKTYQITVNGAVHSLKADTQGVVSFTAPRSATTTAESASPKATVFGQAATFTATVSGPGSTAPTGVVTFSEGTRTLGTGTLSTVRGVTSARFITGALAVGKHVITAIYGGDSTHAGSTSATLTLTVSKDATRTKISASANPVVAGQSEKLTATVAVLAPGAGVPSGSVTFKDGAKVIGTGTVKVVNGVAQATLITSTLAAGTHAITAVYDGDGRDLISTSGTLSLFVKKK
jgi:hypothetical protein